ncbi:MAG TPA: VPLPA-CTERM-specific exosortase XrtD [Steroidobacteraceae bacterium]|nr:VPLPA-CTERM-specific exosortase XrtD [Steroidobacteraceae bacterium]
MQTQVIQSYRTRPQFWLAIPVVAAALLIAFWSGLAKMLAVWLGRPEYSHGVLIPIVALFLVRQRAGELSQLQFKGSWWGVVLVLIGAVFDVIGGLATTYTLQQYGFLLTLYGLVLSLTGPEVFRKLAAPLLVLLLMIPLPDFLLNNFSARLQLISSQLGVWFIRLFDISVLVEGNVIDLGTYKLQVAEACDGLRYLFPLMTLGFIMACLFKAALWKRALLFLSSIPITIVMNSLRIGLIGVSVEYWGVEMAEGFLHQFEGWVVFMASAAVMLLEIVLLARVGKDKRPWREVFGLDAPVRVPKVAEERERAVPPSFFAACLVIVIFAAAIWMVPERSEARPVRESLSEFPLRVGDWSGRRSAIAPVFLSTLKLDDYLMADYVRAASPPVNLYVAWYDSQRSGQSAHSPRSCIPGGGWRITELTQTEVPGVSAATQPLRVNRVLIEFGTQRQLVYYWFQQRGRIVTNEYAVKWYVFRDALLRNRSDGALVRLSTPLPAGAAAATADALLRDFAQTVVSQLDPYIPD